MPDRYIADQRIGGSSRSATAMADRDDRLRALIAIHGDMEIETGLETVVGATSGPAAALAGSRRWG
jgi:hypothetical protein